MINKKKVLAIPGSTRQHSSNHQLIKAIAALYADKLDIILFEGISALPHFNPDDNNENVDAQVKEFRQQIKTADGVLICTPEYAHGVPGTLKNVIDWTVTTNEFWHKPTALITASTEGQFGHNALLETLRVIETENIDQLQLLVQFVRTKINTDNKIKDEKTLASILQLIDNFIITMERQHEIP